MNSSDNSNQPPPADEDEGSSDAGQGQKPTNPAPGSAERPVTNAEAESVSRFVTSIKNPAQQIGEHVIAALKHADTVAVLTTIVVGPGGQQHIVSAALDPEKATEVNSLLMNAAENREEEETCIGFHCLVKPKRPAVE